MYYCIRGQRVAELVSQGTSVVMPGADDNVAEFNPSLVAEPLLAFLRQHPF